MRINMTRKENRLSVKHRQPFLKITAMLFLLTAIILTQVPVPTLQAATDDFQISGNSLIEYNGKDTNVTIPDNVQVIATEAFADNTGITQVTMPDSVTTIGKSAFSGCASLETVVASANLSEINAYAFEKCAKLAQIDLPESVSFVDETAFADCLLIKDKIKTTPLITDESTSQLVSANDINASDSSSKPASEINATTTQVPAQPVKQAIDGMETTEDTSVIGKTKIVGGGALVLIDPHKTNVISDGVSGNSLASQRNENELSTDGTKLVKESYYRNAKLKNYVFPSGILEIEEFAFARSGLKKIAIPDTVTKIGYAAFYHCDDLSDITIPDTVTEIASEAFNKTAWMNQWLTLTPNSDFLVVGDNILIAYKGNAEQVILPDTVKQIASGTFKNHAEIIEMVFPDALVTIRNNAFDGCENLQSFSGGDNLSVIEKKAFENCPIEVTSATVKESSNNYIGNIGNYQVLKKMEKTDPVWNGLKIAGSGGLSLVGIGILLSTILKKNNTKKNLYRNK